MHDGVFGSKPLGDIRAGGRRPWAWPRNLLVSGCTRTLEPLNELFATASVSALHRSCGTRGAGVGLTTRGEVASVTRERDEVDRRQLLAEDLLHLGEGALARGEVGGRRLLAHQLVDAALPRRRGARLPGVPEMIDPRAQPEVRVAGRSCSPAGRSRSRRSRQPSTAAASPPGSSATMSTAMPSWRSCSWSTEVTRSRMWFVWVRIENRAGLPAASSSMPSPFRSVSPAVVRSWRARARSLTHAGAAAEYQRRLPGVIGP